MSEDIDLHGVAIIGMSGRFPGADSIDEYWENISQGLDCTRDLTLEEIIESGVEPEVANNDSYIRRCADLNGIDKFDAAFFDYLPTEAKILDPQARLFLECVQTALDDAGCDPDRFDGSIGVYAGTGLNNYLLKNILRNPGLFEDLLDFQTVISNDKDFLSTQINYKFNLTGPGISVQTACSTSLVAIQLAYQSLLTYQCDVAVSGGTHIRSPRARGNPYKEGEIFSPDGYCRPFDKDASGTLFGEGAGVVVLKRLEDALADRDHIYGVIRGAAINNDGRQKVSYAAPSVKGQAEVVALAQTLAGLDADEIGYVEAHGTGTKLGDPIEIRALTQAFRLSTDKKNYCAIGSGKSMIGHLDVAAGVAGFIRASLALYHKTIPPTQHFVSPNPELKLDESPFYICSEATPWEGGTKPRIAAVSSFGVGGTNAHAIIQEAPAYSNTETKKNNHLLVLSAKTPTALDAQAKQLAAFFEKAPGTSIADAAYTLQMGRRQFPYRKVVVCNSTEQAIERLTSSSQTFTSQGVARQTNKPVMFMFSGQGSQYINMCRDLYYSEAVFAECINTCAEAVVDIVGFNFIDVIFSDQDGEESSEKVKQTYLVQPALYAIECGLARLWSHYGIKAQAMIGHSIGEFAAAYVSGVFSLEEGARIVAMRGKLMQQMQPGAMLGLRNAAEDVDSVLEDRNLSIVVINGPELTVVGGPVDDIREFKAELEAEDIPASLLHTSHAFHSRMMDDAVTPFVAEVSKYSLQKPKIPFISNVTGEWITPEQAVDPSYWGNQMRSPVQFSQGIETLCMDKNALLLEIGPGQALSILCQQQAEHVKKCTVVSSARHPNQDIDDVTYFYRAYGTLWANGANVDLSSFYDEERRKVSLPSYPFERKSFWISSSLTSNLRAVHSRVVVDDSSDEPLSSEDITVSPDISIEGIVTGVWEELLGCDDIQLSDNFFNLGGHSLVASQMLEKVEAICGRKVTLTMLNNSDTLGDFCAAIEALPGDDLLVEAAKQREETSLTSTTREQWSLSPQQERLWFYHEYSNTDPAYNLAQTIVVKGRINLEMLKEAVDHVLSIHEAFNTVFTYNEDWQVIANRSEKAVEASIQSLQADSAEDQESELIEIIINHNSRAKDFVQETVNVVLYVFNDERIAIVLYIPHILTDGLSFNIFYQQVDKAYRNLIENRDISTNVAAKFQYSDYVDWLSKRAREEEPQTLDYWREYLDGVPALVQLPTSHPRPAELSSLGAGLHFSLDADQSAKVKALCNKLNVTPFVFFLSQLYLTLWQYSGQATHVVGAPYANRANEDLAGIVGFFVDMIPIRGDIKASTTFAEWVREIRQSFSEAWDNFKIGLDKIVEVSGVDRHPNAHPLFQVTFTYLSYLDNSLGNDDYSMRQVAVDRGVSEYDLSLYMWEEEEFLGLFEFASDLFTDKAIESFQEHFISIIDWVLADSNRVLSELSMITHADQMMISKVNATNRPEYLSQSFVELFSETASQYSKKPALIYSGVTLSYQELNNATNALAAQLVNEGVGKGSYVGVFVSRGLDTLISLIAIFKTGAAYVPLDPNFPTERLRYIIENSEVNNILVDQENQQNDLLRTPNLKITVLDAPRTDESSINFVPIVIKSDDVAYMIYTSGSTGLPKGVPISHGSLMNFLMSVSESPGIKESDRLLALTTTSFDISLLELLLPLVNGASVVIADSLTARDPEKLAQSIETENITYLQATPVTWSLLFESGWYGKSGLKILSGGEALTKELASKLLSSGKELWNAYGPTEATIWASFSKIEKVDGDPGIGLPMANTSFFVLNEHNRVVPPGVIGELAIGGVPLSPGYHEREELTNEAFIEINIPGKDTSERVYKTGDLALLTVDGDFRCLGRKDSQIKIRGFRIELGEIESTLLMFKDIRETACIVSERSEYDKQIVAYYKADNEIEQNVLIDFLEQYLPDYMVPQTYILLDEFPYTPNAKVDRKKLPAPDINEADISADDKLEPLNPAESKILEIWKELFNVQNIGVTDEFFKLGGNSLLAVRLINVMNDRLGNYWRINHLFTHPTIKKLAAFSLPGDDLLVEAAKQREETSLTSTTREQWSLSPQQERLWFYHEYSNTDPAYNLAQTIVVKGRINLEMLKEAVDHVLSIHEAFNTVFTYNEDWQVIANRSEKAVEASIQSLQADSAEDQESELIEIIINHNSRAKDFVQETVNVVLYVFNDERIAIVLYIPHILTDGLSFNIFYQQVDKAYRNLIENRDISTNVAAKFQYSDYVDWLSKRAREEEPQTLDYWREYLDGVPALVQLPTSHPRPAELSSLGAGLHFSLDADQSAKVKALCNKLNVTPFVFFLSQLYLTLWQYSGQATHVVGAPYANRANEDLAGIVGFFVDMIPIRGDIKASTTFAEWVREIRQSFSEAWDNFKIGLDKIVEVSGVDRHPNAHPLFQVTFTYLSYLDNSLGNDDYSMRQVAVDRGVSEYDLSLYMWEEEEFLGLFEFASDLFTDKAIESFQEHFISIIDWVLADSNRVLSELSMITHADQMMISKVNATNRPEYLSQSFVELFSETASQYSKKPALIYSGVTLSYQELNNATNALAAQLVNEGVGKGSYVGVFVSRGLDTLISLIAIFKTGAAYVPLDPNFPTERLRYIIENSEVNNILVDQENQQNDLLRTPNLKITVLDAPRTDESSINFVPIVIKSDDVAYMIYTSGSTGLPKGVPISHGSLMNFLMSVSESPGIKESDRLLALTTTSFDISLLELLLPLVNGASVVIADSLTARDPEKLAQSIETENITYLQATPVTWSLLFESGWYGKSGLKILSGGEALTKELASKLLSSGKELWNAYGPTEATIWASFSKIEKVDGDPGIGLPMANTSFFVLNEHNRVVPPGVIGELAIGGVPLSPGYHEREELTNEAFIEINIPGKDTSERVYKTGDLALLTVDGDFRCLGRKDSQIKIRGFRIELGEIESTLLMFKDIRETACIVSERSEYDKQIVAYYKADNEIEQNVLIDFLEQYLPDYMVPQTYILLDEFPYTPNAKVDRKKLPAPDINEADISADDKLEPLNPAESKILEIWKELFNVQNIGVTDEFFKLGGNSLLAVRLINVMNDRLGNYWRINHLFTHPTIKKLATFIKDTEFSIEAVIKIRPGGSRKFFFIYDGEGEVMLYYNLANRLPKDFTVLGIMPQSRAGIPQVHLSVEEMAKDCIQQMKRYQPEGPYYYGGLCAGGVISFEMTAQLESTSDKIGRVLLVEAVEPNATPRLSVTKQRIQRFRSLFSDNPNSGSSKNNKSRQFLNILNQVSKKILRTAKYEMVSGVELVSVAFRLKFLEKVLKDNKDWPSWLTPLPISDIYSFARDKYRAPLVKTSNVILVKATKSVENVPADEPISDFTSEELLGWEPFVDEITVLNASAGHSSLLQEPYVEELGEQLKNYLV